MVKCTRFQCSSRKKLNKMIKNISNNTHANGTNANGNNTNSTNANGMTNNQFNGCNHVQLGGMAFYDESKYFLFSPDEPVPDVVQRMRRMYGVAQQMTDGTFDFVAQPRVKSQSKLIRKLAHGRVSKTKDGAIQLTLKITANENINIAQAIAVESAEATDAIVEYQLRR